MERESIELRERQKVWLERILCGFGEWLVEMGYGDSEYIRLHHIVEEGEYFVWDKKMLNELRRDWKESSPLSTTTI